MVREARKIFLAVLFLAVFAAFLHSYFVIAGDFGELKVTLEHPFFSGGEWIKAGELEVGDVLFTSDGKKARIITIEEIDEKVSVFNINVDGQSNFFANSILVHNKPLENKLRTLDSVGDNKLDDAAVLLRREYSRDYWNKFNRGIEISEQDVGLKLIGEETYYKLLHFPVYLKSYNKSLPQLILILHLVKEGI
jgi:hypothetical protein